MPPPARARDGRRSTLCAGPAVDVGEQTFEVTEGEPARREQLGQQGRLAAVQPIRAANNISPDGGGASRLDLLQLGGQPADEVLQPAGEVHLLLPHALDRPVEVAAVSIVELAQREEALEVVACAI